MFKVTILLALGATSTVGVERRKRSDLSDFYQSHVLGHYLQHDGQLYQHDTDSDLRKREVKLSKGGLFYHEGPYIAHGQVQRNAPKFDFPKVAQNNLPHHTVVTPDPYQAHPAPYPNHAVTLTPVQYHGLAYQGHPTPAPHNGYPSPTPFHGLVTPVHYNESPSPYYASPAPYHLSPAPYHGTPAPYHEMPAPFHGTPAPYHRTPAPYHGTPTHYQGTPTFHPATPSPYHGTPTSYPGTPTPYPGSPTPYHGTPIPHHVNPTHHYAGPTPYPNYKSKEHPPSILNLHYQGQSSPIQVQGNHEVKRNKYPYENSYSLPTRRPNHPSLTKQNLQAGSLTFLDQNEPGLKSGPLQPIQLAVNPTANPKNLEPVFDDLYKLSQHQIPRTQPKSKENHVLPHQAGQQTLFQSITQDALDRPVHKKLSQKSQKHKIPKSDALQNLMAIAGDNWDTKIGIEKNLLDTASDNFICPGPEGHFPDPQSCSVYYQCAQGTPHKRTCEPGLNWDMRTNQCDWKANVDCSRNSVYRS